MSVNQSNVIQPMSRPSVEADFVTEIELLRFSDGGLALVTEAMVYTLQPLRQAGVDETWQIVTCDYARRRAEVSFGRHDSIALPEHRIEIIRFGRAGRRLQELRGDALDWSAAFNDEDKEDEATTAVLRGLLLAQVTEALFRAIEIIPVEIIKKKARKEESTVLLSSGSDEQRERVADALRADAPHRLMKRLFDDEQADIDARWELSESGALGLSGRNNAPVHFVRTVHQDDRRLYEFRLEGALPPTPHLYLRKVDDEGTEGALRRRLRMLVALATQEELCVMLADPRERIRTYREPLIEDAAFGALDGSKQEALRSIWSTGPGQFVVGPPGVGKTRLVSEIVRQVLAEDPTARILLSAQGHQALDHLATSVQTTLAAAGIGDDVLLVRSKADAAADLSGAQTHERVKQYLAAVDQSPLARGSPLGLRQAIGAMAASEENEDSGRKGDADARRQRRSFEALVLESANILFSTTNSGDLARLVEDRAQFDWVIVEEAAKATGPELLAPLLLSMRRLLIGDHNQLPPFDTDRAIRFLSDQTRVKTGIAESDALVGRIFRDFGLDDLRSAIEDDDTLSQTCSAARRAILQFESLVTRELERQKTADPARRRVATELLEQHRMHPVIASVISECFYEKRLKTASKRAAEFEQDRPPFAITDDRLPGSPIVLVDMPYVQRMQGAEEKLPAYHNPAEVDAVKGVLSMLQPLTGEGKEHPTLAVLSPYREQMLRIGRAIEDAMSGPLVNLSGFAPPTKSGGFEGTVDSFQGSEADVVVVSLVRNNDHTGSRALGFLRDRRRMNVLLSRAKWKLVIVTSLEFLRVHSRRYTPRKTPGNAEDAFLAMLISMFDRLRGETLADGTSKLSVVSWKDIRIRNTQ
jgi:hypothetical protein